MLEIELVEQPEQAQILFRFPRWRVVERGPREREQLALPSDRNPAVLRFYALTLLLNGPARIFLSQSSSTVSRPIWR